MRLKSDLARDAEKTAVVDQAILDLIKHRDYITFSQLRKLVWDAVPLRLSGTIFLALGAVLSATFGLGWKGHGVLQGLNAKPSLNSMKPVQLLSPSETVALYYSLLNRSDHNAAWQMISQPVDGPPPNYDRWIAWWNRVDRVSLRELVTVNESPFQAVVRVRLEYRMKNGQLTLDKPFKAFLVRDSKDQPWKIHGLER